MPVDAGLIEEAATLLRKADAARTPIPPVRDLLGTRTDIDAGYAVQQSNTDYWVAQGRRVSGRKIGVTSKAVMQQVGVDQPDFGTLFADTEYGDGIEIEASRLIQPRAEAEVALVLEHDLTDPPHGFAQMIKAVAFALPAVEVVDSRIANWDISIVDTVADNASCGLYVVGSRPVALAAFEARTVPMRMTLDGQEVSTGIGSACLGNPLHAARWLADVMATRGIPLRAGDVIMTGALGPMVPFRPGQELVAEFGDLGTVTTRMSEA
ncbi:MAG TPA: fumarylacetoacetate hydrolase family protein [Acidimicrobiales bacterium]|nr:fumarylacetoacetate hydrolase family protein [Acidimicrobiales bacterium]